MDHTHLHITCRRISQCNGRFVSGCSGRSSRVRHLGPLGLSALGGLLLPNRHARLNAARFKSTTARSVRDGGEDGGEHRHRVASPTNKDPGEEPPRGSTQTQRLEKHKGWSGEVPNNGSPGELSPAYAGNLPSMACDPRRPHACETLARIEDPRLDPSLSKQVYLHMSQMLDNGMTAERAADIIRRWSDGAGAAWVDLRKLRRHFLMATLLPTLRERLPEALLDVGLTALCFWALGQLPAADEALLHPALRGALVAANLMALVRFASGSVRTTGRVVRIASAALRFSERAELVLLALQGLAEGRGAVVRAVAGTPAARRLGDADVCVERVLAAMQAAMRHAQQQEAAAAEDRERRRLRARQGSLGLSVASVESPAGASGEGLAGGAGEGGVSAASCALGSLEALLVLQAAARGDGMGRAVARGGSGAGGSVNVAANNVAPATAVGSSLQQQGGASPAALSDTVPAPPAAAVAVGFDPAAELGLSAEEASRAAAAYARYGDRLRCGRMGEYELRRLMQDAGAALTPLSDAELSLALLLRDGGRKGWLSFRDWAHWWAGRQPWDEQGAAGGQQGEDRQLQQQ